MSSVGSLFTARLNNVEIDPKTMLRFSERPVSDLLKPGDFIRTSYNTSHMVVKIIGYPYKKTSYYSYSILGIPMWRLKEGLYERGRFDNFSVINELVVIGRRILKLLVDNNNEVFKIEQPQWFKMTAFLERIIARENQLKLF